MQGFNRESLHSPHILIKEVLIMAKYVYPAIISPSEEGGFDVSFPDISGCYTEGASLAEALEGKRCIMSYALRYGRAWREYSCSNRI